MGHPPEVAMALYVDGFVLPCPKTKVDAYRKIARKAGRIWREHGALDYKECVGDDLVHKGVVNFPKLAGARPGETVIFAYIVYKSRAHRDRVNKKVLQDPRMNAPMPEMPFDVKRMAFGGFRVLVSA
jgi:uncharacterized protein YbaA (DUF1428 family)